MADRTRETEREITDAVARQMISQHMEECKQNRRQQEAMFRVVFDKLDALHDRWFRLGAWTLAGLLSILVALVGYIWTTAL